MTPESPQRLDGGSGVVQGLEQSSDRPVPGEDTGRLWAGQDSLLAYGIRVGQDAIRQVLLGGAGPLGERRGG